MDKISIIVPVYNQENRLVRCLDSLVNQTFKNLEIIIINDGSTDKSIEIIKKYQKKHQDLIRVIDRENKGISVSRNEGLSISTGDYIGFVDSDDYVELNMFDELYKSIKKENADIAVCDNKEIIEGTDNVLLTKVDEKVEIDTFLNNPKMIYLIEYAPWNKLYKRYLWDNIKFPENMKYEDINAVIKVFKNAKKIVKCDGYFYNYIIVDNSQTRTINHKVFDVFWILDDIYNYFIGSNKKISLAIQELCISKIFIYNHFILRSKNIELEKEFIKEVYKFINSHFKNWKIKYIFNGRSLKNKALRILQTVPGVYKIYCILRIKK